MLARFQVFCSYMWLMATILGNADTGNFDGTMLF